MDRRHFRIFFSVATTAVAVLLFASVSHAQLLGGKGGKLFGGKGGGAHQKHCEECVCTPYTLDDCYGQHACCGCGCAHSGFCNWCGHGKNWGWVFNQGGFLPKCCRAQAWKNLYHGHGGCGHGCGHGGCCANCGGSGNDLFYNYYAPQTGAEGGVPTDMYAAPHDTPHPAIQTYYTYQPWLPHEHLYHHNRSYLQYNGDYGMTRTNVSWGSSPIIRHFD